MTPFTSYELLWLFFLYSFAGWVLETAAAALKQRRFVNRGLVNGPFCVIYGITAAVMSIGLQELSGFWLFVFAAVYATVAEWMAGHLIELVFHERWWNYSESRWNLDGYVCLPASVFWGILGYAAVHWGNGLILSVLDLIPDLLLKILLLCLLVILLVDVTASVVLLSGISKNPARWAYADDSIDKISRQISVRICRFVERRILKAYPKAEKKEELREKPEVFAAGCGFYKLVMLFMIGAFLGDVTETIFCRATMGVWMSRSSVVWGPFSIVWGLAIALATLLLYPYQNKSDSFLFAAGTLLGGAYEYLCSVFTEIVFGKVFWDYSAIPFNLGGRINLLYSFFWGIAAVVWLKKLFPLIEKWIAKIPVRIGKIVTWVMVVFMICNISVTCVALVRYDERDRGVEAQSSWQSWADEHYGDDVMKRIYPKAKGTK